MKPLHAFALATALSTCGIGLAQAQDTGFYAAIGGYMLAPKSNTGALAGGAFQSSINNNTQADLTLGYNIGSGFGVELFTSLDRYNHTVSLNGADAVRIKHRPILLTAVYHFLPQSQFQPFVGLGYGQVQVGDIRSVGPLDGAAVGVSNGNGVVAQAGVDYMADKNVFFRVGAYWMRWRSNVTVGGAGVGRVDVSPFIYGASIGYRF